MLAMLQILPYSLRCLFIWYFLCIYLAKNSSRREGYNNKSKSCFNETKFYRREGSIDEGTGNCPHKKMEADFILEDMLELELLVYSSLDGQGIEIHIHLVEGSKSTVHLGKSRRSVMNKEHSKEVCNLRKRPERSAELVKFIFITDEWIKNICYIRIYTMEY